MLRLLLFSALFISFGSLAQDSAKVLFIGNSYTYANNLPVMVSSLANTLGDYVYQDDHTAGGANFATHAGNASTYNAINSDQWDYVVLQAQSQEPSFSDFQVNTQTLPYAMQMADSVYADRFCSEVQFFMTWGRENGDPQWAPISTYEGMQSRLRNAYVRFADSVEGSVSPVGMVWKHVRDNHPGIDLYVADGSHPSVEGTYLAACTFYASVFRKSPVGASFISTVDPTQATQIQQAAALVVLDSLDTWNLRPFSEHTQADFTYAVDLGEVSFENGSTKAQTYSWDFGDGQTSTDVNPVITYTSNGQYTVTLIAESECDVDTISYLVDVQGLGFKSLSEEKIRVLTIAPGKYSIQSEIGIESILIYDFAGNQVDAVEAEEVDLTSFAAGVYLVHVKTKAGIVALRVVN